MIKYLTKDITTVKNGIVVHGVNCQLVMGAGVALAIKNKWPESYSAYMKCNMKGPSNLGKVIWAYNATDNVWIANLFSQDRYGSDGQVYADKNAILNGMIKVMNKASEVDLPIYIPKIGCGLGGLIWEDDVLPALKTLDEFANNRYTINVCEI